MAAWVLTPWIAPFPALIAVEPSRGESVEAWEKLATFFPNEAMAAFAAGGGEEPDGPRAARFGHAVALLTVTPSTEARIAAASQALTELSREPDDFGLAARYLLGRVAQIYLEPAQSERAAAIYGSLIAEHPASRWAQRAMVRQATLLLFSPSATREPAASMAAAEALLPLAADPSTRRNLHLIIAQAHFFLPVPAAGALSHLLATLELPGLDYITRGDVLVQIASLLRETGRRAESIPYLETFIREYRRDSRRYLLEREIEAIRAGRPFVLDR